MKPRFGERTRPLVGRLLAGSGVVTSAEHGYAVFNLAAAARSDRVALEWLNSGASATQWRRLPAASPFRAELAKFLDRYGSRAVYEVDLRNPRWAEDPSYILDQVRHVLADPKARSPRDSARRILEAAKSEVKRVAGWRRPLIWRLTHKLRNAMAARETAKSTLVAAMLPTRRILLELGSRLVAAGRLDQAEQILELSFTDLYSLFEGWWDGGGARELALDRARQREHWLREETPPDVITQAPNGHVVGATCESVRQGEVWTGIAAAPGEAGGRARIVLEPNDARGFCAGDVLAAPSTDPGWTPLFVRASAIVMETGGYLSHGAIVAREYGIPAVVNIPGILTELVDGEPIVVDGDRGRVFRESAERRTKR